MSDEPDTVARVGASRIPEDQYSGLRESLAEGTIEGEDYEMFVGTGGLTVEFTDYGMAKRMRFDLSDLVAESHEHLFVADDGGESA